MKPPSRHPPRGPARPRAAGFTLLALVIVLAALGLLVLAALRQGEEARREATLVQHEATALSAAEAGLERTRAWLAALRETDVDFDRALDPGLNTDCTALPALSGTQSDDHLPPFTGGTLDFMPGSGQRAWRVPYDSNGDGTAEGAYLVRIDDNDDDLLPDADVPPGTSNNTPCTEGPTLLPVRRNPVRDRDGVVTVTVVGLSPASAVGRAQARRSLRVLVGPRPAAGIIAGGDIRMAGASHVCGLYGNVATTGSILQNGCLCGAGCTGGPASQNCTPATTCVAEAAGPSCTATSGSALTGVCTPDMPVDPPPPVELWDRSNAPGACTSAPCTPFYYLRWSTSETQLYAWKYAGPSCANPQACSRIFHPGEAGACAACWKLVYAKSLEAACPDDELKLMDDPGLHATDPVRTTSCGLAETVWKKTGPAGYSSGGACDTGLFYPGPAASLWAAGSHPTTTFEYDPSGTHRLPPGVWLVEGNARFEEDLDGCEWPFTPPLTGVRATVMAVGDIVVKRDLSLEPALPSGVVLLAGRDLDFSTGNGALWTCDTPAAVLVHEQFQMNGDKQLQAQLVVQNGGTCSSTVSGEAVQLSGNATVSVPRLPPIPANGPASVISWSESSY